MKRNYLKFMFLFATMAFICVSLVAILGLAGLIFGGSGVAMAMAGTAFTTQTSTTETVDEGSPDLLRPSISKKITEMKPSLYPLDTILRKVGTSVSSGSWTYKWYNIDQRSIKDEVKATVAASGTTAGLHTLHEVTVNNVHNWNVDDIVMFVGVNGNDGGELVMQVVDKVSSQNKLTLLPINGLGDNKYDIPQLAAETEMVCIGNAKAEKDAQTSPYAGYPLSEYNYHQIHMAQVEQSLYEKLHTEKEVNWDFHDYRAQALYDYRRKAELTSLFGVRNMLYDPVGEDNKYFSGGIVRMITKKLEYATTGDNAINNATFAGWGLDLFTGNSGSEQRVAFIGGLLNKHLLSIPTVVKQIEAGATEVKWGIRFNKIDTGFGELLVKYHHMLDVVGWSEQGIVLDVNYLEKSTFKPMETTELKLKESGQKNVSNAQLLSEAFCIATRYPDLHAIISKNNG